MFTDSILAHDQTCTKALNLIFFSFFSAIPYLNAAADNILKCSVPFQLISDTNALIDRKCSGGEENKEEKKEWLKKEKEKKNMVYMIKLFLGS